MGDDIWYCEYCGAIRFLEQMVCFACRRTYTEPAMQAPLLHQRYRLQKQVGIGGFGCVYRALDTRDDNRSVAIKQINLRALTSEQIIEATDAFNRELQLLSSFSHPQLPHLYEHFTDAEHWYLVMSFIAGETLEQILERQLPSSLLDVQNSDPLLLPLPEILRLTLQLCTVLDYLHTRTPSIIFRDLKPSNIMRTTPEQMYMLIDFGIARSFKPGQQKDTIPFGSPGYAAPEQYGKAQTTPQSDMYSLGALLYYLISGHDPAEDPFHFVAWSDTRSAELRAIETLVSRMVALDATQRPASISEIQTEIQQIQQPDQQSVLWSAPAGQNPPQAWPTSATYGPYDDKAVQQISQVVAKSGRRTFLRAGLVAGVALCLVGPGAILDGFAWVNRSNYASRNSPYQRVRTFPSLIVADGSLLIQQFTIERNTSPYTTSEVNFIDTKTKKKRRATLTLSNLGISQSVSPAPDGKTLFAIDSNGSPSLFEVSQGTPHLFGGKSSIAINHIDWSPNGSYFAGGIPNEGTITVWSWPEFKLISTITTDNILIMAVAWSADNRSLAIGDEQGNIHIFDVATGVKRSTYSNQSHFEATSLGKNYYDGNSTALSWSKQGTLVSSDTFNQLFFWENTTEKTTADMTYAGMVAPTDLYHAKAISYIQWSPDERYLALMDANATNIYIYDVRIKEIVYKQFIYRGAITWQQTSTGGYQLIIASQAVGIDASLPPTTQFTFQRWLPPSVVPTP